MNSSQRMTEIKFWGCTYRGTAEGDHGVFTHKSGGRVYAGKIANHSACVGVHTLTSGRTEFVECDADGKGHGRLLDCTADGDTWYWLYEHGSAKERAVLFADGTCEYNGKPCRADYAPFVALRAQVVPIKARPRTSAPHSRLSVCRIFSPPPPANRSNRPLLLHSQELATTHADRVRTCRLLHQPAWASWHSNLPNKCTARPTWTTHRRKGAPRMRHKRMRGASFRRLCPRSEIPCASALPITCRTPSGSVAVCGGLQV
jgi:hypothetical protein